jgi:hypothetical protein
MSKTCDRCPLANLHDYDGTPVAKRKALEQENARLRRQVETLTRALKRLQTLNAGAADPAPATVGAIMKREVFSRMTERECGRP